MTYIISIHALLAESDCCKTEHGGKTAIFLSTLSLRRATGIAKNQIYGYIISIHALLAESDRFNKISAIRVTHFYPRSPCGERLGIAIFAPNEILFLSTLSLRRATLWFSAQLRSLTISIHALLAESDESDCSTYDTTGISIHALLAESDSPRTGRCQQSRISIHALLAESDRVTPLQAQWLHISIHALLAESDGNPRKKP